MNRLFLCLCLFGCPTTSPYPATEGTLPGECTDDADNDADGLFDCNDPDCFGAAACQPFPDSGGNGGLSQEQFVEQAQGEVCRILVACELYADVASCHANAEDPDFTDCTYDSGAARACVSGLQAIEGCPDPFMLPAACSSVHACPSDTGG
ncbi:MAG: hypothetical protein KC912_12055 [Proteobacteria bacterium]|nr:hypothetical protein [Pseudomonadota bacterium]